MAQRWRLPRVRFTVRRLMIVVAIVGFAWVILRCGKGRLCGGSWLPTTHPRKNAKSWISDRKGPYFRPSYSKIRR